MHMYTEYFHKKTEEFSIGKKQLNFAFIIINQNKIFLVLMAFT